MFKIHVIVELSSETSMQLRRLMNYLEGKQQKEIDSLTVRIKALTAKMQAVLKNAE